jgi:hypothetical protein
VPNRALPHIDESYLLSKETSSREPISLRQGRMILCPWCERWAPKEAFTELLSPAKYTAQCAPIYKHGGDAGCKRLFSIAEQA